MAAQPPKDMPGSSVPRPWWGGQPPQFVSGPSAPGCWWGAPPRPKQAIPKSTTSALNSEPQDCRASWMARSMLARRKWRNMITYLSRLSGRRRNFVKYVRSSTKEEYNEDPVSDGSQDMTDSPSEHDRVVE